MLFGAFFVSALESLARVTYRHTLFSFADLSVGAIYVRDMDAQHDN